MRHEADQVSGIIGAILHLAANQIDAPKLGEGSELTSQIRQVLFSELMGPVGFDSLEVRPLLVRKPLEFNVPIEAPAVNFRLRSATGAFEKGNGQEARFFCSVQVSLQNTVEIGQAIFIAALQQNPGKKEVGGCMRRGSSQQRFEDRSCGLTPFCAREFTGELILLVRR